MAGFFSRRMAKTALPITSAAIVANGVQGTRYACTAFYAHPSAWAEIGFPGPAYPRGYKNAGVGKLEPFEVGDAQPAEDPVRGGS